MRTLMLSLSLLLAAGCGSSSKSLSGEQAETTPTPDPIAEPTPPPKPEPGDPKDVGPTIYKSLLENDTVRGFEVTFKPGDKIGLHKHPEHVIYVVSGGKLRVTAEDGTSQDLELKAGEALFSPAAVHTGENTGDSEVKLVVVEMMKKGTAAPEGKDPIAAGPKIYKLVLDDPHVRVMEVTFKKGAKIAKHAHPDHAVYVLSGGKLEVKGDAKDAKAEVFELQPGSAVFLPAQAHTAVNKGPDEIKLVVFEVRP